MHSTFERYTDRANLLKNYDDFVTRHHGLPIPWLISAFIGAVLLVSTCIYWLLPSSIIVPALFAISATFLLLGIIVAIFVYRSREVVMATEFQNALFASAARIHNEFCLIIKYDGTVIYADPGYYSLFAHARKKGIHGIDAILECCGLSTEDQTQLLAAISRKKSEKISLELATFADEPVPYLPEQHHAPIIHKKLTLLIDPISRPDGYFFLRAFPEETNPVPVLLENIFDCCDLGVYAINDKEELTYTNQSFLNLLGYQRKDMIFKMKASAKLVAEGELGEPGELVLHHKQGALIRTLSYPVPNITLENIPSYHIVVPSTYHVGDMSEEDVWRMFENAPIAKVLLDDKGTVLRNNAAFRAMVGKEMKQAIGWNIVEVLQDVDQQAVLDLLRETADTRNNPSGTGVRPTEVRLPGDRGRTALLHVNRLSEPKEGQSVHLMGHLIDTTDQKDLELRFAHSQKMQAVGQLAGGVAHDFNNLLTAMIGFCDLLLVRHPAGDQSFPDIMQIKQNAQRAAGLVRQLLAFSRKQTIQPKIIDISNVIEGVGELIERLIGEKVRLVIHHGSNPGMVRADQGQLDQVFMNLAVNAKDAMPDGGTITIRTSNVVIDKKNGVPKDYISPSADEVVLPGNYVLIEVSDTGHGISKEVIGKIFEPFFSTKDIGSGTGLGLSTVYGIIKQFGGYLYVSSKEGKGTKFSMYFKNYAHTEEAELSLKAPPIEESQAIDLTGKGTVLLVEDETPVRIFSANALTKKGYSVIEADSGESGLQMVEQHGKDIDIIVTDVIMPGINGPTMVEEIHKKFPDIKVIFVSGYSQDAFTKTYGSDRPFHFLSKPFTLKQLASMVKNVLNGEAVPSNPNALDTEEAL